MGFFSFADCTVRQKFPAFLMVMISAIPVASVPLRCLISRFYTLPDCRRVVAFIVKFSLEVITQDFQPFPQKLELSLGFFLLFGA
jgi:hypothetical protein